MKKTILASVILLVVAACAYAGVGIDWSDNYRVFASTETDLVGGTVGILDVNSAIWQLIYAGADGLIQPPDFNAAGPGIADNYVQGDDAVWAQRTLAQIVVPGGTSFADDGTEWSNFLEYYSGNTVYADYGWSTPGSVYMRIFEGTPSSGSLYYDSGLMALNLGYTASPETSTPAQLFGVGDAEGGVQATMPVPEPATMGLLGLGALVMAIRRRRS